MRTSEPDIPKFVPSDAASFVGVVRARIERTLVAYFDAKARRYDRVAAPARDALSAIAGLTLRGGKRIRPAIAAAAMLAVDRSADLEACDALGASIELFHTSLLAHDDVMDAGAERRGGPSLPAQLSHRSGNARLGDSLAILAGDLASVHSLELFGQVPFHPRVRTRAFEEMLVMREDVGLGQFLDLVADPDLGRTRRLKTGSYTVSGPARLGALLARGDDDALAAIDAWAMPLGEAFQIADDLLGAFGDPARSGKPADDVRQGKLTAVVADARARCDADDLAVLEELFGDAAATDAELAALATRLERAGVREALEARIDECLVASDEALGSPALDRFGAERLRSLATMLGRRDR